MSASTYRTAEEREPDEPPPTTDERVTQTWSSRRSCPRCELPLFAARRAGIRIDACGACGGVWMTSHDAQLMLERRSRVPATLARVATSRAQRIAVRPGAVACPDCRAELTKSVVPPHDVEIDVCPTHGTWFDRSELERVVEGLMPAPVPPPSPPIAPVAVRAAAAGPTAEEIARAVIREKEQQEAMRRLGALVLDALLR